MAEQRTVSPRALPRGRQVLCGRQTCQQLLAYCRGDALDCFVFVVRHSMKMVCERCKYETRWTPGAALDQRELEREQAEGKNISSTNVDTKTSSA